jgi:hypothetical protein
MKEKNLNESIIEIRCELQAKNLKKSGKNKFAGFDYFELSDFLPTLNELMKKYKINDVFTIKDGIASLTLILGEEKQEYTMPFVIFDTPLTFKKDKNGNYVKDKNGDYIQVPSMQDIQYLGALNTYYKRYLYLNAFGITDGEIIDSMDNSDLEEINHTKEEINHRKELINYCNEKNLNMNEIAVQYKLNGKSKDSEFKKVLEELKKEEQ